MSAEEKTLIIQDPVLRRGFTAIPNAVMFAPGLSMAAKCLYAVLLSFAWQEGECFPGQDKLAKACDCTDRTIRKYLDELREYGLISWVQRGLNRPNIYYIHDLSKVERLKDLISLDRKELSGPDRKGSSDPDRKELSEPDRKGSSGLDRKGFSVLDRKELSDKEYSDEEYSDQYNVVVVNQPPGSQKEEIITSGASAETAGFDASSEEIREVMEEIRETAGTEVPESFVMEILWKYGKEKIFACLSELKRQLDCGVTIKGVGSWLRRALERDYQPDRPARPKEAVVQPHARKTGPGKNSSGFSEKPEEVQKKKKEFIKSLYV